MGGLRVSKFPDKKARKLYQGGADEEVGSSTEGLGWAGLYRRRNKPGGHVLVESTDGSVDHHRYDTDDELLRSWGEFQKTLDNSGPDEDDWIIREPAHGPTWVHMYGSSAAGFQVVDRDTAIVAIKERMTAQKFYPDVWVQDERGDFLRIEVSNVV